MAATLAERRDNALARLDSLRRRRGAAVLDGKTFDDGEIIGAEQAIDALAQAEVESVRRERDNEAVRLAGIAATLSDALADKEEQRLSAISLLQDITQIAFNATDEDFDELVLEVELGDGETITATCHQTVNGKTEQLSLEDTNDPDLSKLSFELKDEMKNHTGGNLKKYAVRIDEEGKANASFEYDSKT